MALSGNSKGKQNQETNKLRGKVLEGTSERADKSNIFPRNHIKHMPRAVYMLKKDLERSQSPRFD